MRWRGNRRCWARRPQLQCPMRPRGVVVGGVPGKHLVQVSLAEDQRPVGTSVRSVRINRSAKQFARGHRGRIFTTSIPASARTASNAACSTAGRARPGRDVAPRRATVAATAGSPKRRIRLLGDQTPSGRGQGPRVQGASREVPGLGLFRCSGRKRGGVRCGGRAQRPHLRTGGSRTAATSTVTPPDVLGRCGRSRCWRRRCMPAPSAGLTSQFGNT